jgi:hypothetical protein
VRTLIDISPGVSIVLEIDDAERSWVAGALAVPRCEECRHAWAAHERGCSVVQETFNNGWKRRACGCTRREAA